MLYTSNKITAAAIREVQYPTTKNAEFEAGITLADGMGMDGVRMKWNSWTKEMNNVANGLRIDGGRMKRNNGTQDGKNVADEMGIERGRMKLN